MFLRVDFNRAQHRLTQAWSFHKIIQEAPISALAYASATTATTTLN